MASKKNKTENFLNAVKTQSEEQRRLSRENILSAKKDAITKAETKYQAEAQKYINRKLSIAKTQIVSEYAIKNLNSQAELFKLRDNMVNKIFAKAKEKLLNFTGTDNYRNLILKLAGEISETFGENDCIIYLKSDDLKYADEIKVLFNGNVSIETDEKIIIGGIKGYCKKLNIVADNTLDSKLTEERSHFTEKAVLKIF